MVSEVTITEVPGFPAYGVDRTGGLWTKYNRGGSATPKGGCGVVVGDMWKRKYPSIDKKTGHMRVVLYKNGKSYSRFLNRIVLETFVGPRPPGMEARHYPDQNPANNAANNLSWATPTTNQRDRKENGTDPSGERHGCSILTEIEVLEMRAMEACGEYTRKEIASCFPHVRYYTIYEILVGKKWKHLIPAAKQARRDETDAQT